MADVKISQLPEVIDPYLTDVLPIVNNNDTKKVTVGNIVALGYQGNDVRALTGKYEGSSSIVSSTSGNWNSAYDIGTAYSLISGNFLTSETDSQLLTYEENSTTLYISNGNNVSLSALNYQGTDLKALTGRYEEVSTNVQTNSADWEKAYDIGTAYSLASSTFITFESDNQTLSYNVNEQDLTIRDGNTVSLFSLASKPYVNSYFLPLTGGTLTNSLCALSSLYVGVTSTSLFVGDGVVGVLTETPNVEFTVNGQISSNNVIYDRVGNSDQWNSAYDASVSYRDISGSFVDVRTAVNNASAQWDSAYDATTMFRSTSSNYAVYNYVNSTFLQLTGGTINGDLSINGNLFLEGSATLVGAKNLVLDDPIIYLAEGNPTDLFDMGFVASYNHSLAGLSAHTGLLRNRNDKKWVLFSGLSSNLLSATQVDFNDPSLIIDTVKANLEGNVIGGTIRGTTLSATGIVYALNGNSNQWNSAYDASVSYRDISGSFVDIRTAVNNTSAEWDSAYDATTAYRDISGSFVDIRTAVNNTSAEWDSAYDASTAYRDISGSFVDVRTAVNNTSAQWDSAFNWSSLFTQVSSRYGSSSTVVETNSADWKTAYNHATAYSSNSGSYATNTTLNTVSSQLVLTSDFNNYKTDVAGITATFLPTTIYSGASGNWESAYTTFKNASSTFLTSETDSQTLSFNEGTKDLSISNGNTISLSALTDLTSVDTGVRALTSNWESAYTTFKNASSTFLTSETDSQTLSFNEGTLDLSISNGNTISLSALNDLTSVDTGVRALTSNWESVYLTVKSLSSSWEESSEILPTVTNYLSSQNVLISSLTVVNNLSAGGNLYGNGSNLTG